VESTVQDLLRWAQPFRQQPAAEIARCGKESEAENNQEFADHYPLGLRLGKKSAAIWGLLSHCSQGQVLLQCWHEDEHLHSDPVQGANLPLLVICDCFSQG
jgi:hypothetical protein